MSIYVIADLHLSFAVNKPMNIFGDNWDNHAEKIKKDWLLKVKPEDYFYKHLTKMIDDVPENKSCKNNNK